MHLKYTFLNGELEEEAYIEQLEVFQLLDDPNMFSRLKKMVYGLK